MKPSHASLLACAIAAFAGTAVASSGSLVEFKPKVMPVVVQVNAQGRVTDILPSRQLTPGWRQMLVKQLDGWIIRPATVKGHLVGSRFIVEVAMQAKPRKDGNYDASFVYVKSLAMPFAGAVHWNVINGGLELALVSDLGGHAHRVFDATDRWRGNYQRGHAGQPATRGAMPRSAFHAAERASSMPTMAVAPQAALRSPAMSSNGRPRTARQ
jgi:hypothetical protein